MSLSDDFKNGEIQGFYWCKVNMNNKETIMPAFLIKNIKTFEEKDIVSLGVFEVLTSCDYEELQRLKGMEKRVNDYVKKNKKLKQEIKYLKDLQAVEDKEIERLRDLLQECKNTASYEL